MVDINQSERDALVVRGYLSDEERDNGAAIKKAIEAVLSDIELDLQFETAERSRARVSDPERFFFLGDQGIEAGWQ